MKYATLATIRETLADSLRIADNAMKASWDKYSEYAFDVLDLSMGDAETHPKTAPLYEDYCYFRKYAMDLREALEDFDDHDWN